MIIVHGEQQICDRNSVILMTKAVQGSKTPTTLEEEHARIPEARQCKVLILISNLFRNVGALASADSLLVHCLGAFLSDSAFS